MELKENMESGAEVPQTRKKQFQRCELVGVDDGTMQGIITSVDEGTRRALVRFPDKDVRWIIFDRLKPWKVNLTYSKVPIRLQAKASCPRCKTWEKISYINSIVYMCPWCDRRVHSPKVLRKGSMVCCKKKMIISCRAACKRCSHLTLPLATPSMMQHMKAVKETRAAADILIQMHSGKIKTKKRNRMHKPY